MTESEAGWLLLAVFIVYTLFAILLGFALGGGFS